MLEPIEGLVVSLSVLVDAECMHRQEPALSQRLADDASGLTRSLGKAADGTERRALVALDSFLSEVLGLTPSMFARAGELPEHLELYIPEGGETLRCTLALKKRSIESAAPTDGVPDASTPQSLAGAGFVMLVHELPGISLEQPDPREGHWAYAPALKFERLLRRATCRSGC